MDIPDIKKHWQELAKSFRKDLNATTKTKTIKDLEIDALLRVFASLPFIETSNCDVLEVGCGNGLNCVGLQKQYPNLSITGVDYVPEMIEGARELSQQEGTPSITFQVGDILKLSGNIELKPSYEVVYTVRCLINLPEPSLQLVAVSELATKVASAGSLICIENFSSSYERQNELRMLAGLAARTPDAYNCFIDEKQFCDHVVSLGFRVEAVEDFASLHDVLLYVLIPAVSDGAVVYDHPIMHAVTNMLLASRGSLASSFGSFGQNRLYHFIKET